MKHTPQNRRGSEDSGFVTAPYRDNRRIFLLLAAPPGSYRSRARYSGRVFSYSCSKRPYTRFRHAHNLPAGIGLGSLAFTLLDAGSLYETTSGCGVSSSVDSGLCFCVPACLRRNGGHENRRAFYRNGLDGEPFRGTLLPSVAVMALPTFHRHGVSRGGAVFSRRISRFGESLGTLYAASTAVSSSAVSLPVSFW